MKVFSLPWMNRSRKWVLWACGGALTALEEQEPEVGSLGAWRCYHSLGRTGAGSQFSGRVEVLLVGNSPYGVCGPKAARGVNLKDRPEDASWSVRASLWGHITALGDPVGSRGVWRSSGCRSRTSQRFLVHLYTDSSLPLTLVAFHDVCTRVVNLEPPRHLAHVYHCPSYVGGRFRYHQR